MKLELEFYHFHSRKCIWNCRLPKWLPFCPGEMRYMTKNCQCCRYQHHPVYTCLWVNNTIFFLNWGDKKVVTKLCTPKYVWGDQNLKQVIYLSRLPPPPPPPPPPLLFCKQQQAHCEHHRSYLSQTNFSDPYFNEQVLSLAFTWQRKTAFSWIPVIALLFKNISLDFNYIWAYSIIA